MADLRGKLIYETPNFRLFWDDKTKVLESTSLGQVSSQEFRASLEKLLAFMQDKKARKYLSDMSNAGNIAPEDLWWTETDWIARVRTTSVKVFAIVMPKSLAGHLAVDKVIDKKDLQAQGIVRMAFKDIESAREWIVKQ